MLNTKLAHKKYKCDLQEKIPKLNYIHQKVFFNCLVQTLAFFHVKHICVFFQLDDTIFSTINIDP